jgi:hypothetical protein
LEGIFIAIQSVLTIQFMVTNILHMVTIIIMVIITVVTITTVMVPTLKVLIPAVDTHILAWFKKAVDMVQEQPPMEVDLPEVHMVMDMDTVTDTVMVTVITEVKVLKVKVVRPAEPVIMSTTDGLNAKTKMAAGSAVSNVTRV